MRTPQLTDAPRPLRAVRHARGDHGLAHREARDVLAAGEDRAAGLISPRRLPPAAIHNRAFCSPLVSLLRAFSCARVLVVKRVLPFGNAGIMGDNRRAIEPIDFDRLGETTYG
jgi:hypothetical protein